jgi:GT2 family glycosyltransferase
MADLVSILIPAYKAEKWIEETINSALSQTWRRKEIIIVDDGSPDDTLAIAKQFESKFVKVLSQENRGASAARNRAYSIAQGEYIQWLDADDLLSPNKINEQMQVAGRTQTGNILYSAPHGIFYYRQGKASFIRNSLWEDLAPLEWLERKFNDNLWMNPAAWLLCRRLAEKAGPWDERLSLDDDGEYIGRVVAASDRVIFVEAARCYYRRSGYGQLSLDSSQKALKSMVLSLRLSIQHLRSMEDSETTRRIGLMLLQRCFGKFYPEKIALVEEMRKMARELGGELEVPRTGWKLSAIHRLLGWKRGKKICATGSRVRLTATVEWDHLLHKIGRT